MITNDYNKEIRSLSDMLRDLGYTDTTIGLRQHYWREYYNFKGSLDINEKQMNEFLLKNYNIQPNNINLSKKQYEVRAALRNLLEFRHQGKIVNYHTPWFSDMPWVDSYKAVVDDFLKTLYDRECLPNTILNYERTLKKLTNYLHSIGVESFEEMTPAHITSFLVDSINRTVRNLKSTLCNLRVLFRYLYLSEHNPVDLSLFLPKSNVLLKRRHIPTTWTRDDVNKILSCIDVANPVGKRDYAMILLVARVGLRVSDVIKLRFKDIKWEHNCIHIVQQKTKEPLVLPLFEDVGNSIIDYIKNGRPIFDSDIVFITHKPPFGMFSPNNHLYGVFKHYLVKSGIVITPDKNHGMHTLRHTLANELLRNEIPLPVIAEILGHKSLESTMQYLRADTEQLRYCTLTEGENYAT